MSDKIFSTLILEFKRASLTDEGVFEGYAATFDGPPDAVGDIIQPGAFRDALASHKAAGTMPAMVWNHDLGLPVGKWLDLNENQTGLLGLGKLTLETKLGAEGLALMRDDAVSLSICFSVAPGGSFMRDGIRHITRIAKLYEISIVALPANHLARVHSVKLDTPRNFEKFLRDAGLSNREAKRACAGGWRGLARDEHSTELDVVLSRIEHLETLIVGKNL